MMDSWRSELVSWFKDRPRWVQEAASLILTKGCLAEEDIAALLDICLKEADSEYPATAPSFPADSFHAQSTSTLRLCTIGHVKGINALAPRRPLDFGQDNMAVVYGGNGSGKSGYVRLLKHACGVRNPGKLYPNVFEDDGSTQSAEIKYSIDNQEHEVLWSKNDEVQADLRSVDIFDADCGRLYLENESEVTYEPPLLLFFSDLIAACSQVEQRINDRLERCIAKKPQMPSEYAITQAEKWYSSLTSTTPSDEIVTNTKWETEKDALVASLGKRLAEKTPAERAKELLAKKSHADGVIQVIEDLHSKLTDEKCLSILKLKKDMLIKREAAQAVATKVFSGASLDGIGTEAWKLLWEHARRYSETQAYRGHAFPYLHGDARCVLCHQLLSEDAQQRLASFEEFIKGQAERDVRDAEKVLQDAMTTIGDIPNDQAIKMQCDAGGLTYQGDMPPIVKSVDVFRQRKEKLLEVDAVDKLPQVPDCVAWLQETRKRASGYSEEATVCHEDAASDTRPQLQNQLRELKARKWVSEQRDAIREEIERLKSVDRLVKAKRLTETRGLSQKKGVIAEALITDAFVKRFRDELAALGASRIKVELVKKRVDHGRVLHELRLAKARSGTPRDVLSEGEHRVVSLAAFLADVTGKMQSAPFVFDDPISSLDQDFEEAVVQRLVRLSSDRQVIVFTHRVSLLVLLQDYGNREGREPKVLCVRCEPWGTGEPGDTPLFTKKPGKLLNALLNEHLTKARKVYEEEGQTAYEPYAKAICSNFRNLLERMIESELLADVVQRFRRSVNTQGKLDKLARITAEDCKFFDNMMTKYSRYEHSQPKEAPVAPPAPDELKADLEELQNWQSEFVNRTTR